MPVKANTPIIIPAVGPLEFPEWRQLKAVQDWPDPAGPLAATIVLRRCRRADPSNPQSAQIDMTEDQERAMRAADPDFRRDFSFTIPNVFAELGTAEIATMFEATLAAIQAKIIELNIQ